MIEIIKVSPTEAMRFKTIRLRSLKDSPENFGTRYETAEAWDEENWISFEWSCWNVSST